MTMLVPFSGKYCFHGRMEMEAGDQRRLSRTVAPKLPPPTAELAEEKKSDLQHRTMNRLKQTLINHRTLFWLISYDYYSFIEQYNFWLSSKVSKVQIQIIHVLFLHKFTFTAANSNKYILNTLLIFFSNKNYWGMYNFENPLRRAGWLWLIISYVNGKEEF